MVLSKRLFDLLVCLSAAIAWLPTVLLICLVSFVVQGRPLFYTSTRRVFLRQSARVPKFRAMVKNAEQLANRDTIPVSDQRFLNLDLDSPLYTPLGRFLERSQLVEIPQFFLVLQGKMSLVGNRPLPENVIASLLEIYPDTERRFDSPAGVAGPTQLIGRGKISDVERLDLEILYADFCIKRYSPWVDFLILLHTVLVTLSVKKAYSVDEIRKLLS
jgi:lipopolysaccharide/colanic/teichoic acid biosynthesis glycosyltransferase